MKIKRLNETVDKRDTVFSQEFYDLMQEYRTATIYNQSNVIKKYQNIISFIEDNYILKDETIVRQWLLEEEAKKYNL